MSESGGSEQEAAIYAHDASLFQDPFAPHADAQLTESVFPTVEFIPTRRKGVANAVRPYIQHVLRTSRQITAIKCFPYSDGVCFGSVNTLYSVGDTSKLNVSCYFRDKECLVVEHIDIHPSEFFVACNTGTASVQIVSLISGLPEYECNRHKKTVSGVFFAPSFSRVCSSSVDGTFIMTDLVKRQECYSYDVFKDANPISTAAMRHDETVVAFGFGSGEIGIFDHRSSESMTTVKAHAKWVNSIDFAVSDVLLATCGIDRSMKIWDLRNLETPVMSKTNLENPLKKALFLNDGSCLSVCTNGAVTRWNTSDCLSTSTVILKEFDIVACDVQTDARKLVFSAEDMILSHYSYADLHAQ